MRRISLFTIAPQIGAALFLFSFSAAIEAGQGEPLREQVVKLGQVTGDDVYEAKVKSLQKDPELAKKLVGAGMKMAEAKDQELSYYAAMTLGQLAGEFKDYKACEALYRVAMNQASKLVSTRKILQSYGGLADALFDGKKYAESVHVCRELLELKTADGNPRNYLFIVDDGLGDVDFKSNPDFDVAKRLRPEFHQLMIQSLAKEGKHELALKLTDSLVRANDNWKERQLRGWVLGQAGRYSEAAKVYEDVLERIAKDKDLTQKGKDHYTDRYRHALSTIYVEAKQIDKATELLKSLIDRHPDEPGYYNDLGYIWADHDLNLKESEEMIRKALALDSKKRKKSPDFDPADDHDKGAYLDSLGWVLFKQKHFEEAKKYLLEALKDKDSQHLEIFDHLGDTYIELGEREAALDAWRRGLAVAGDDRHEQERKAEVEKKIQKHK